MSDNGLQGCKVGATEGYAQTIAEVCKTLRNRCRESFQACRGGVRMLWCAVWGGHDTLLKYEDARVSLECQSCGFQSAGWDVRDRTIRRVEIR